MVLVWQIYYSDLGRAYPMYALSVQQISEIESQINVLNVIPDSIIVKAIEVKYSCNVPQLTSRKLILWLADGGQYSLNYPEPFDDNLAEHLTANTSVQAWEFVGEKIKYGRLRRMLNYVRS